MNNKEYYMKKFGKNFNTIDNIITILKEQYHTKFFKSMKEFVQTPYFHIKDNMSIDEYTDDYITENENYLIIMFDDYRDFKNATINDNVFDDIVIAFDKNTKKITKYFYTSNFSFENKFLEDLKLFCNN